MDTLNINNWKSLRHWEVFAITDYIENKDEYIYVIGGSKDTLYTIHIHRRVVGGRVLVHIVNGQTRLVEQTLNILLSEMRTREDFIKALE